MRRTVAIWAGLVLAGMSLAANSAAAAEQCKKNVCASADVERGAGAWKVKFTLRMREDTGDEFFLFLVQGHPQMKVDGPGNRAVFRLDMASDWNGVYAVEACRTSPGGGTGCLNSPWSDFQAELLTDDDRDFCNRYAADAAAKGGMAGQMKCGFDSPPGRWSTDASFHLNWCLGQLRGAGPDAGKLEAARNLAVSEDQARSEGLNTCQVTADASAKAYADQRADEMQVTGKSAGECQSSNQSCEARFRNSLNPSSALAAIAKECTPYLQQCLANAAAAEKSYTDQRAFETQVTGKTAGECQTSNQSCEARIRATYGLVNSVGVIASECTPYLQMCMANAAAALAATSADEPAKPPPVTTDPSDGTDVADGPAAEVKTATVKRDVNVHLGDRKGEVVGSLPAGTVIEIFGCDDFACRVPFEGDEGFVAKSFLDLGGGGVTPPPAKKKVATKTPDVGPSADAPGGGIFAGVWDSKTDKNWSYVITLKQIVRKVSGGYVAQDGSKGTITGDVAYSGNELYFKWTADGGFAGTGYFKVVSDGVMDGSYDTTVPANMNPAFKTGSWHAERR